RVAAEEENEGGDKWVLPTLKGSLEGPYHAFNSPKPPSPSRAETLGGLTRRFDLTRLVPSLLAAAAASKPWSERALRDVTMFTAESAC
ncbi:transposase, partial [Xanthomonas oryzae pv. oryzae]